MVAIMIWEAKNYKISHFKELDNRPGVELDPACSAKKFYVRVYYKNGTGALVSPINWATTDFYGSNNDCRCKEMF
jgi:hypothetical protein